MLQFQAVAQTSACGTPTNLAISNVGAVSAKASWTSVVGAMYYKVSLQQAGTTFTTFYSSSQTNITMSFLNPSTAYSCTVAAICSGNQTSAASAAVTFTTTVNASCGTPQNVTATNTTGTNVQFAWTAVTGAQSYRIKLTSSASTVTSTYSSSLTSYTVSNLLPNTTYTYNVSAVCGGAPGAASANATITTPTVTCGTPTGLAVSAVSYNTARLDWAALAGASYYKIEYKETSAANYTTTSSSQLFYNFYNLKPNTNYTCRISAVCSGIAGTPTATSTFTTLAAPACNAPTGVTVSNISFNSAKMSWTAVPGVTSYRVSMLKAGATTPTTYSTSSAFYNFSYLDANTTFTYTVSSFCNGITGSPSASGTFTTLPAPACPAPVDVTVTNIAAFSATISWSVIPGVTSYRIVRTGGGLSSTFSTSALSYNMTSLSANTTYTFTVSSVCSNVTGTPSAPVTATTLSAPSCVPPTNVTASNIDVQKATISWTPIAGVTYYRVLIQAANSTSPINYGSSTSSLNLTTLLANTTYTYSVAATCGSTTNVSAYSAPQTFTTLQSGPCTTPTNVTASNITSFKAKITWDSVPGVNYWRVQVVPAGTVSTSFSISYSKTFMASNLIPGTAYDINVTAVCPASVYSSPGTGTFSTPQAVVCPDLNEPNNAIATATPLTVGSFSTGAIDVAGDLDYFSFATTTNEPNMKITLTNLPKDYDLKIYNSTGTQVAHSLKGSTQDEIIKLNGLPVGTYYAHVFGFANAFTPYACYSIKAEIGSAPFTLAPTGGNGNTQNSYSNEESERVSFNVFPNPVQNEAIIDFSAKMQGKVNVAIMDLIGRTVKSYDFNVSAAETRFNVDLSELQNGMYMMNVNNGSSQKSAKIVVNK